jgi:hypothetical protein
MIDSQSFSFSITIFSVVFSVLLVAACLVVSWIALTRTNFKRSHVMLELLRLGMVSLVALAICQPEWLQRFVPSEEPVVAVVWDESGSMDTEDVLDSSQPDATSVSRRDSIQSLVDPAKWESFSDPENPNRVNVAIEPFSSLLTNPKQGSDLNAVLASTMEQHSNLRAVVMISDGSWNVGGSPTESATQLRMKDVPVFTMAVGSDKALPDLEVASLDAPTFGVVNKPTRIPFSINSTMARDVQVNIELVSSDGDNVQSTFLIPANDKLQKAFVWSPKKVGEYTLTIKVPPADDERITANNELSAPISIRKESLKVLVVDSFPRWEYRYLRNALARDPGVEVSCLLYHPDLDAVGGGKDYIKKFPKTLDELSKFDVIFLGDVGVGDGQLTGEDCRNIKGLVENQATGLILMPGFRGRQLSLMETQLSPLFPVLFDMRQPRGWGSRVPAELQLTEAGSQSLLTKLADSPKANTAVWRGLPGFQWYAPVLRAKVGSQVLAVHASESNENGRIALLATKTFGSGKILFMGTDGAWRWREGVEDKYHYRVWGQVARWMAYQRNMAGGDSMRLFYSPDRPRTGETLSLNANVMALDGEPLQNGNVNVQIVAPSGNTQTVKLSAQSDEEQWGLFSGFFVPEENGEHFATVTCQETGASLDTKISVQGLEREKIGRPANLESLGEIAAITRGKMVSADQIQDLMDAIKDLKEPEPQIKRIRLWAHPIWAGTMILLLGLFWVGRKLVGFI